MTKMLSKGGDLLPATSVRCSVMTHRWCVQKFEFVSRTYTFVQTLRRHIQMEAGRWPLASDISTHLLVTRRGDCLPPRKNKKSKKDSKPCRCWRKHSFHFSLSRTKSTLCQRNC